MMKKISILVVFYYFILIPIFSQSNECKTTFSKEFIPKFNSKTLSNHATINVKVHIIRKNNGGGNQVISESEVITAIEDLKNDFSIYNICIVSLGIDYINSTYYYRYKSSKFNDLINEQKSNDAIDIYIVRGRKAPMGQADNIPGRALIIKKQPTSSYAKSSVAIISVLAFL